MTDPTSSPEDPFADLFSRLPAPKERDAIAEQAAPGERVHADSPPAPLSRRAARESATREGEPATEHREPTATTAAAPPDADVSATGRASTPPLDDLFSDPSLHAATPRKKRRVGGWIALGVVVLLVGGAVTGGVWVWNTYQDKIREVMGWEAPKDFEAGQGTGETLVTIASGDNGATISTSLYDAGVTKTESVFYDMLIKTKQNPTFYPGVYTLQKKLSAAEALKALLDPASKMENSALLREGLTVAATLPILAEGLGIPLADFEAAVKKPTDYGVKASSLEGWLFPAVYTFDPGVTAKGVIQAMVNRTVQSLDAASVPVADRERILTIASIIQREARFDDDFYKVSRVIYNRLDSDNQETFGKLQMDSTAQYGFGELHDGTASSSAQALADDNPWNTYVHPGLPIGPIANPGDKAIDAAMHPVDGPWLYFVTVNLDTGQTVFSTTLAQHNKAVAQWQKWCSGHPNSGC